MDDVRWTVYCRCRNRTIIAASAINKQMRRLAKREVCNWKVAHVDIDTAAHVAEQWTRLTWKVRFDERDSVTNGDLHRFNHARRVHLVMCNKVTDVSALRNIGDITLEMCLKLKDVGSLRDVPILRIRWCPHITDVSALGNVRHLQLWSLNVEDVSALGGIYQLWLLNLPRVTDVSALGGVSRLTINECLGVTDISALGNVKRLSVRNCGCEDVIRFPQ